MAPADFKFKGKNTFLKNLNKEIQGLKTRTHAGLIHAAIIIQREAEPGTPIDTGNLRASWFAVSFLTERDEPSFKGADAGEMKRRHNTVKQSAKQQAIALGSPSEPVVIFGYSANYAPFVHEAVDANFNRPGAHARWLYAALQRSYDRVMEVIRQHAEFK